MEEYSLPFNCIFSRILISAPKGSSPEVYKDISEPGILWRCSLGNESEQNDSCIVLPIDPIDKRSMSTSWILSFKAQNFMHRVWKFRFRCQFAVGKLVCSDSDFGRRCRNERRDESWFGMILIGNSERMIICVPKWQRGFKNDNYKLNGLCYWLPTEVLVSEPFSSGPYDYSNQRLVPLLNACK